MGDKAKSLYWLLGAVGINRLCSLVPAYLYFDPFPFYDILDADGNEIGITLQSYIYFISSHVVLMTLFHLLYRFSGAKYAQLFTAFFLLQCASLVDFLLIYEHPIFYLAGYGVEFTDFKLIAYTYLIVQWNLKSHL